MRSQGHIKQQLKQVTFRHLKKKLRELFKQRPDTCQHNLAVVLDADSYVCLCGVLAGDGTARNIPCDPRIPGCLDMARECPLWHPLRDKVEVKAEFHAVLRGDRGLLASQYPDIAALMWVLDDPEEMPGEDELEAELADDEEPEPTQSWVQGWLKKLGGGK
jgi:hypothetical protein